MSVSEKFHYTDTADKVGWKHDISSWNDSP